MTPIISVNGVSLPTQRANNPSDMEYMSFGTQQRMLDGTMRAQLFATKWRMRLFWHGLSQAERDTLFGIWASYQTTSATWVMADGKTLTAITGVATWNESHWYQPHSQVWYYDVNFAIEQA